MASPGVKSAVLPAPVRWTLVATLGVLPFMPAAASGATLPAGFTESLVASGLASPTAMAIAPDGRIFICLQDGQLRVVKNGALLPTAALSLSVDSSGERGLLGIAFDPGFGTNGFLYLYYTALSPQVHNRVSRFTVVADLVAAGSELPILDLEALGPTNHNGGAIHFGPDGKLYVAVGENGIESHAQTLGNRLGKILRINADGSIPADNPFFGVTAGVNRAIWALGLRNPFTFGFQPVSGRMFINDVGQGTWEEINDGAAGANYGWPACEGPNRLGSSQPCGEPSFTNPVFAYDRRNTGECAITGAAFYNPSTAQFPAVYTGNYFFSDLCGGWIRRRDPATGAVFDFVTDIPVPVDLHVSADGSLYYLARGLGTGTGVLSRITYAPPSAPSRIVSPAADAVLSGPSATFTWDAGTNVQFYWVNVGSVFGGYDLYSNFVGTSRSLTVSGLPTDGRPIWVRLHSFIAGRYEFIDHRFVAATTRPAAIVNPAAGTVLTGPVQTFTWEPGVGAAFYWVNVGRTRGGYELYSNFVGAFTMLTVSGLPIDGRPIWVRLHSFINGRYEFVDHEFTAASPRPAVVIAPAPGGTLAGPTQTFSWDSGLGVSFFWVEVGSVQGGYEFYSNFVGAFQTLTVGGLPIDGRDIWVRLYSFIGGSYRFTDQRFRAASPRPARLTAPIAGAVLSSATQTFQWDQGVGVGGYWLDVGTSLGGYSLFSNFVGTERSWRVTGLPLGGEIWVRIWSRIDGQWTFVDQRFGTSP